MTNFGFKYRVRGKARGCLLPLLPHFLDKFAELETDCVVGNEARHRLVVQLHYGIPVVVVFLLENFNQETYSLLCFLFSMSDVCIGTVPILFPNKNSGTVNTWTVCNYV